MNRQMAGDIFILSILWGLTLSAGYRYFITGAENAGLAAVFGGLGLPAVVITYKVITGKE